MADLRGYVEGMINLNGGGGGGSTVVIEPVLTSGTKIADVSVDGVEKDLYAPTPTPPTPATEVTVTQVVTEGTKIATIGVDGVETDLYAPESEGIIYSITERKIGKFLNQDLFDITIDFGSDMNFPSGWNTLGILHQNKYALIFDGELISTGHISYHVDIAANDPTYIEIAPNRSAVGRYLYFKYTKSTDL